MSATFDPGRLREDVDRKPDMLATLARGFAENPWPIERTPRRVLLLGMGSSYFAADVAARRMRARGLDVVAERASLAAGWPATDDLLVVAVSAGGSSVETLAAVEPYADSSASLVALTNVGDSPLEAAADAVVPMLAGVEVSGVSARSFTATQARLLQLEAALTGAPLDLAAVLGRAADAVAHLLASSTDWIDDAVRDLVGPDGTWLLSPAERLATAEQAALMLRERPRRAAVACETGDWSHVDVYLTKTLDYRALLHCGSRWDEQAIDWMRQRATTFWAVGAEHPDARRSLRYPGDDDETVALLAEVTVAELIATALPAR